MSDINRIEACTSFYGFFFFMIYPSVQILSLTKETRIILPSVVLSVTVPHTLSLPDQVTNSILTFIVHNYADPLSIYHSV